MAALKVNASRLLGKYSVEQEAATPSALDLQTRVEECSPRVARATCADDASNAQEG